LPNTLENKYLKNKLHINQQTKKTTADGKNPTNLKLFGRIKGPLAIIIFIIIEKLLFLFL
jgi:hypothetical protein